MVVSSATPKLAPVSLPHPSRSGPSAVTESIGTMSRSSTARTSQCRSPPRAARPRTARRTSMLAAQMNSLSVTAPATSLGARARASLTWYVSLDTRNNSSSNQPSLRQDGNTGGDSPLCCSGSHATPDTCPPAGITHYDHFKNGCPNSYVYGEPLCLLVEVCVDADFHDSSQLTTSRPVPLCGPAQRSRTTRSLSAREARRAKTSTCETSHFVYIFNAFGVVHFTSDRAQT